MKPLVVAIEVARSRMYDVRRDANEAEDEIAFVQAEAIIDLLDNMLRAAKDERVAESNLHGWRR